MDIQELLEEDHTSMLLVTEMLMSKTSVKNNTGPSLTTTVVLVRRGTIKILVKIVNMELVYLENTRRALE